MPGDPYKYFRVEAHEIVGDLAKALAELETSADPAIVTKLLRYAHTLKGAARIVRHKELAELSHQLETVLEPLRTSPMAGKHDAAVAILDQMTAAVAGLDNPSQRGSSQTIPPLTVTQKIDLPKLDPEPIAAPPPARLTSAAIDDALGGIATAHTLLARLREARDPAALARGFDQMERELDEVRRDVEHLRLSAVGSLYSPLERTARDAAKQTGKHVQFEMLGSDVRIDAQVLASLQGALVQLVRNAVVHGIVRDGRITISARSQGKTVALACTDNGRGLDLAAIRTAAAKHGHTLAPDATPQQAFELLLRGGVSTARELTELSGRGIGLDVVRDAVAAVNGEVVVKSDATGTAITLIVPVSVSALAAITVQTGDRVVAIPQAAVRRVTRVKPTDFVTTPEGTALQLDDTTVLAAPLGRLFGGSTVHGSTALFLEGGAAITVDRTLGVEEVVVRTLPSAPIDPIVAGMVIDAAGIPFAVAEPRALVAAIPRAAGVRDTTSQRMKPILVVDDSLTTRMLEQSILESAGYDVVLAVSAEDALEQLKDGDFAMMLADVEMPGMDGFTLVHTLRAQQNRLPAVLVTSRDAPEDRKRGIDVGAQGYVVKGKFDQNELLALVAKLVATK
ncbi:MAG: response regulator [Kofleriaceae bacterium]